MSTVEDFRGAPVGATATHADGSRAVKIDDGEQSWMLRTGAYVQDELVEQRGYTLDPPTPTTAREALYLAWELAHPVKEGQVIPLGAQYLKFHNSTLRERTAHLDIKISPGCGLIRTLEPLPDPEPDWLDAPAVMARLKDTTCFTVWQTCDDAWCSGATSNESRWVSPHWGSDCRSWRDLRDVTPLYPKEEQNS